MTIKDGVKGKIVSLKQKDRHKQNNGAVCNECDESFSTNVNLYLHIKSFHSNEEESGYESNADVHKDAVNPVNSILVDLVQVKNRKAEANKKRRAYYKTKAGLESTRKYKENNKMKRWILNHLFMSNLSKKAGLSYEIIVKLLKML